MPFIHEDFLLGTGAARRLYHKYAEPEPVFDYHSHLSPRDIAANRRFNNLFEIWLAGDHYKWRAMRANGVAERYCTGDAPPFEKFKAWAATVPRTLRNPLYHWTHLELKRHFGITELLDEKTAGKIWKQANEQTGRARTDHTGHPEKVQGEGHLHHGRSGGRSGASPRICRVRTSDEDAAGVPARPGARSRPARQLQPVGGTACRRRNVDINGFSALRHARWKSATAFSMPKAAGCPTTA